MRLGVEGKENYVGVVKGAVAKTAAAVSAQGRSTLSTTNL